MASQNDASRPAGEDKCMIAITVLVVLCLVSAIITYSLGVYVFSRNPRSPVNLLFFATMIAGAYWAFGEFMIWQTGTEEWVRFWLKASAFWPLAVAFSFHFVLAFTDHPFARKKNLPYLILLVYLPCAAIALAEIISDSIYVVVSPSGGAFTYLPVKDSPAYLAMAAFIVALMLVSIHVGVVSYTRAKEEKLRLQNGLVTAGILVLVGFGSLSGLILPACGIFLPNFVFVGIIIFSYIITYAIIRHDLFTLSPQKAVSDILRTMPDGLVLIDKEDRIVSANAAAAAIFGTGETDLCGKVAGAVIPEPAYTSLRSSVLAQGAVSDMEAVLDINGHAVVSIAASLVKDPDGGPAGFVLIARDITARKAQEKALSIANEKISLLSKLTRHDISNLVTALGNYLSLLREETVDGKTRSQYIALCQDLVEKITRHLRFSREYQQIGVHEPAWQSLTEMVDLAVGNLAHEGVEITSRVAPVEIHADPLSYKVIYNLFENALHHGGSVSQIRISSAGQVDGSLLVVVEDNGVGIRDEEKEQIFRRGYGKHTGLGLTLSREVLSVTGITIAETGTHGRGARFEIRIPPAAWRYPAGRSPALQSGD
ncbi:MAG: sensory histidine kinase AtoS [Methanoregula sp. PtaU1.Bin051]|nr:MAG: sensory histidine kinase AtoS [Methanoregula sp. PtaU1.Bin051]